MALETVVNNLQGGYKELKRGSMRTNRQLMDERRTNPDSEVREELRNRWFYTAESHGYFATPNDVEWAIVSDTEKSPLFRNIDVAFEELRDTGNYLPSDEEALAAKNHPDTLVVPMSKLRLLGKDGQFRYLAIRTSDGFIRTSPDGELERYEAPTKEEQEAKDRLGYTVENLTMLKESPQRIRETRIWPLNPGYVQEEAGKVPGRSSLWRASRLVAFGNDSVAGAIGLIVVDHFALRGVRASASEPVVGELRQVPERARGELLQVTGAVAPENGLIVHYNALLASPQEAIAALNDQRAAGLAGLLREYLATRRQ